MFSTKKSGLLLLFFGLAGFTSGLKADFFAYQRWVHKKTGQTIHEFFDNHMTESGRASLIKQQQYFAGAVKACNGLALMEDNFDTAVHWAPPGSRVRKRTEAESKKYEFNQRIFFEDDPMGELMSVCRAAQVECINIDLARNPSQPVSKAHLLDEEGLKRIRASHKQHIFLAAGGRHIAAMNNEICKDFELQEIILHPNIQRIFTEKTKDTVSGNEKLLVDYLAVILASYKNQYDPYQDYFASSSNETDIVSCMLASNPIDIQTIFDPARLQKQQNIRRAKTLARFIKWGSAIGGYASFAYLLHQKKHKPAALALAAGAGLFAGAHKIARWWYGS